MQEGWWKKNKAKEKEKAGRKDATKDEKGEAALAKCELPKVFVVGGVDGDEIAVATGTEGEGDSTAADKEQDGSEEGSSALSGGLCQREADKA